MQLRDWRLRKRLLFSNFIMIFIPVLFTVVVSIAIFLALQFGNINRASIISFIWPESGQNMSIQFELSRLRVRADQYNGNMDRLLQAADHLEDQGLNVSIWRDKEDLYDTDGIDKVYLRQQVMAGHRQGHADFTWTGEGLRFYYVSPHTDIHLAVAGAVPSYSENEYIDLSSKDILKVAFYVLAILTILLTILVGLKLSRWMAGQIVGPVERLRNMADAISQGDLDHPVPILSRDEIGDTCQAFEKMRLQLRAARDTREKYDKNRKELLAGISHDLSTPLTKIEGYASGILDGIANTPEKERHYLGMIVDTSRHMAGLVREGLVDETGKLVEPYFHKGFPLASTLDYQRITLSQQDIREIQMAKSAIRAGIELLIERSGISRQRIHQVFLAGGFGYYLDPQKAAVIGLLPADLAERTTAVGNTSLKGAIGLLTGAVTLEELQAIAAGVEEIVLGNDEAFQRLYIDYLNF
jgi:signal transduction histidine kinase